MVKDQHPHAVKEATAQVLPVWLEAFKVLLNSDPRQDVANDDWDGLTVRIQIFKVRYYLHCYLFRFALIGYHQDVGGSTYFLSSSFDNISSGHTIGISQSFANNLPDLLFLLYLRYSNTSEHLRGGTDRAFRANMPHY